MESPESPFVECRKEVRQDFSEIGRIVTTWQRYGIEVELGDLSRGGARLRISPTVKLPPTFDLWIDSRRSIYPSRICWRRGDIIGIEFIGPARRATTNAFVD